MRKLKIISIFTVIVLVIGYALSINPNGKYLAPVANLIKKKAHGADDNRMHTLNLEDYRPKRPNQ
ncbi:MAG: hypothetical protein OEM38_00630 [Gammaproteobacteria bacterium]|nr:hypothetical protein [Gammaproteobacteria bacterium]